VVSVEQLGAEEGLQALQLLTERGLADVEALRGAPDVAFLDDGHEGAD
jgi:hypothetical protein